MMVALTVSVRPMAVASEVGWALTDGISVDLQTDDSDLSSVASLPYWARWAATAC
jgi:hypothetical protein